MEYKVGISCVGGGVGQSVISSCRLSRLPIHTIGLDTNPFAYGAYDCDQFEYIPSVHSENYISCLIDVCKSYSIDLIIPGLDDEILMFAQNKKRFESEGIKTIVSGQELIKLCRDKEQMSVVLNRVSNVFVSSYSKETITGDIESGKASFPLIAKPRGGSASKGINIIHSHKDLAGIGKHHIIQELAIPAPEDPNYQYYHRQIKKNKNPQVSEISIQIVTDKHGNLLGKMASYNKLKDGIPIEVVPVDDKRIWEVVDGLIPHFLELGLKGPLNIQGRLTEKGLKIFEMNPRFTGITGLRALMGFNEVESCLASWLDVKRDDISLKVNHNRFGVRQTASKAIPIERNDQVKSFSQKINIKPVTASKTVMVTDATTHLGHSFICNILMEHLYYNTWAYAQNKEKLSSLYPDYEIELFDHSDLASGRLSLGNVDVLIHISSFGSQSSDKQIAEGLNFASRLFTHAASHQVPAIINISSHEIYGASSLTDDGSIHIAPPTSHAQALYATELMLQNAEIINNQTQTTTLRLPLLTEDYKSLIPIEPAIHLIRKVLQGESIKPAERSCTMDSINARDAMRAIDVLLDMPETSWKTTYDIGLKGSYDLKKIATTVKNQMTNSNDEENLSKIAYANWYHDHSAFAHDTGWTPIYGLQNTIQSLCNHFHSQNKTLHFSSK